MPIGFPFRYQQIFDPAPVVAPQLNNPEDTAMPGLPVVKAGPDFTPETQMQERLEQLLNQFPQKKKAGILHKIAASLAGFGGGPQAAIQTMEAPYQRDVNEWRQQFEPIYQAANLERQSNQVERQALRDETRYQTEQDKLTLGQRKQDEIERKNLVKEETDKKRAAAYDFYSRNRNWKAVTAEDGTVWFVNPIPPHQKINTGLKSGELNEYDKIMWGVTGRMMEQDERHKDRLAEIEASGANTIEAITKRDELKVDDKDDKSLLPNQQKQAIINKARELIARDAKAAEWIEVNDDSVEITRPGKSFWTGKDTGPTQEEYDAIVEKIYGSSKTPSNQIPPEGTIYVKSPDGKQVKQITMKELDAHIKKGWKKVVRKGAK